LKILRKGGRLWSKGGVVTKNVSRGEEPGRGVRLVQIDHRKFGKSLPIEERKGRRAGGRKVNTKKEKKVKRSRRAFIKG